MTMKKKNTTDTKNSKILHQTLVSLGALKGAQSALQEMHINEIQVHILDGNEDGVVLCLEYDESTGELSKTFSCVDEYYEEIEVELEDSDDSDEEDEEIESFIEEAISEEYDEVLSEVFHSSESKPPLLN